MLRRAKNPMDNRQYDDKPETDRISIELTVAENNEKRRKKALEADDDLHSISWLWPLVILSMGCLLYYLVNLQNLNLPTPISESDTLKNPELFSAERSRSILKKLTDLGPRVVGSKENEVYTPEIIEKEILKIKSAAPSKSILYERQKGSGSYYLAFKVGFLNVYDNIQNVIVLLEGSKGNHSILVNCHYDSVPASPGGSDDGIMCSVMLELLRALASSKERLEHNIIFLFNGAEETVLQASHLFLQHEWAMKVRLFLNMEAAGQGGREMLFQSGPKNSWILDYYAKYAPHPHAQVFIEEIFQSGFIPSDTDFRVFRDFGNIPGLDFAIGRNGYVYHTIYDNEEDIPLGTHQHIGDNMLALLKKLGNAQEIYNMEEYKESEVVFYDYLNLFMVSYSVQISTVLNIFTVLLSLLSVIVFIGRLLNVSWLPQSIRKLDDVFNRNKRHQSDFISDMGYDDEKEKSRKNHHMKSMRVILKEFVILMFANIFGQLLTIGTVCVIAIIVDKVAPLAMPWFSNVWLIFPIYWCPSLVIHCSFSILVNYKRQKSKALFRVTRVHFNLIVNQITWTLYLFILTCFGIKSSSLLLFPVFSNVLANLILHFTTLYKTVHKWIIVYLIIHIPSLTFTLYYALMIYVLSLPIQGRSGAINSDLQIGVITSVIVLYVTGFATPLMGLVKKQKLILACLTLFSIIMIIISLTTSVGFPYKSGPIHPAPQRQWIVHAERELYDENQDLRRRETGYFILNLDRNNPRTIPVSGDTIKSLVVDCEEELNCALPFYTTRMIPWSRTSAWIPADPPKIPNETGIKLKNRCKSDNTNELICNMEIVLSGPDRLTLIFSPREGAEFVSWSLSTETKESGEWKERPFYFVHIVRGEIQKDYEITLTFKVTEDQKFEKPFLDIGLGGNHAHHDSNRTKEFKDFIDSFPDWTTMTAWISSYKGYVF